MIWRRPEPPRPPRPRPTRHGRHGRLGRSSVVPPPLPAIDARADRFDMIVGDTAEYLRDAWSELRDVRFEIGFMPSAPSTDGIPRWTADRDGGRIVLYRLPIERLERGIAATDAQSRMSIEAAVFRAAADYLDRDPWDLFPDRHRH